MKIPFIKIQNLGNDYVYVDQSSISKLKISSKKLAVCISDRNLGVGSDGLFVVKKTGSDSGYVEMYNSDGSQMEVCGNGLRGAALYMRKKYGFRKKRILISTKRNEYELEFVNAKGINALVRLNLGTPDFNPSAIGLKGIKKNSFGIKRKINGKERLLYCVAMPNPHVIIFVDNFDFDWQTEGNYFENNSLFENRTNVMFVKVENRSLMTVFPWERGAGATKSCGSGAAASTVIASLLGYVGNNVKVKMPGGVLKTFWDIENNQVIQEGSSQISVIGKYLL